jgi:hypothetical protein
MNEDDLQYLLRECLGRGEAPSQAVVDRILTLVGESSFSPARRNVPVPLRDRARNEGYVLPDRTDDLTFHWAKHVVGDRQWSLTTSATDYLNDALAAFQHPASRLCLQIRHRHLVVTAIALTTEIVPATRVGQHAGEALIAVYSVTDDRMLTAYMVFDASVITRIPGTLWLRA